MGRVQGVYGAIEYRSLNSKNKVWLVCNAMHKGRVSVI